MNKSIYYAESVNLIGKKKLWFSELNQSPNVFHSPIPLTVYDLLSYGDYDNSCAVERANVRYFKKHLLRTHGVYYFVGGYGSEAIALSEKAEKNEKIGETLVALADYPCIDDELMLKVVKEIEDECWKCWIRTDLSDWICEKLDLDEVQFGRKSLRHYYEYLKSLSGETFVVEAGGTGYIDLEELVKKIDADGVL